MIRRSTTYLPDPTSMRTRLDSTELREDSMTHLYRIIREGSSLRWPDYYRRVHALRRIQILLISVEVLRMRMEL